MEPASMEPASMEPASKEPASVGPASRPPPEDSSQRNSDRPGFSSHTTSKPPSAPGPWHTLSWTWFDHLHSTGETKKVLQLAMVQRLAVQTRPVVAQVTENLALRHTCDMGTTSAPLKQAVSSGLLGPAPGVLQTPPPSAPGSQ